MNVDRYTEDNRKCGYKRPIETEQDFLHAYIGICEDLVEAIGEKLSGDRVRMNKSYEDIKEIGEQINDIGRHELFKFYGGKLICWKNTAEIYADENKLKEVRRQIKTATKDFTRRVFEGRV